MRAHEQAHQAAAGGLALGGASFSMRMGPDGRMYAVGGEVQIDTSKESDPDATLAKARQIRAAANAPAEPSAQDRAVAAEASRMESEARRDKAEDETGRTSIGGPTSVSGPASLSGPPELSGPTASVSGPPQPLNRRMDALGRGDGGDVDGPFSAADYQRQYAALMTRALRAADALAADNAYAMQMEDAAQALRMTDALTAADNAYATQMENSARSEADAYARALDLEAQSRTDMTTSVSVPPEALPPQGAYPALQPETVQTADAEPVAQTPLDITQTAQPIDVTRAVDPASALAAGNYPLDRPSNALFAFNASAINASAPFAQNGYAAPVADPRALRSATETPEASASALRRASRMYQRVDHVPTSLAPYGTGISRMV